VPTPSFCAKSQNPVSVANTDVMDSATVRRMTKEIFFSGLEPSPPCGLSPPRGLSPYFLRDLNGLCDGSVV
ncbi:MAG: hypothetical protein LBD23_03100, partial [Oscillospiraceae bacterium]|nr:hypothetical protein [Oscillospiraceae bacterium]